MAKTKEKNKDNKVGIGRLFLWNSRAVSTSIVTLLLAYLMIYCTDTLKVPPAYVSIILVDSKVLDGVTDMFAVPLAAIGLFKLIRVNRYILIIVLMIFVFIFVCNMGVQTYYFTYIVGAEDRHMCLVLLKRFAE